MSKTITIRTDESLHRALEKRAMARGITLSQEIRKILQDAVEERPLGMKTRHLRGRLALNHRQDESWRKTLRDRNWRS
ncbi:MAG: FitA-like ribbon-helix-helix domain-containing protein [Cyclonatronaceae bacterium]